MIVGLQIAGFGMGAEIDTKSRPGLEFNRYLVGYAIGTQPIIEASLIRNGKVWKTLESKDTHIDFQIDDTELLSSFSLEPREDRPPFTYYYLRIVQTDGHIAWSSPIWIDLTNRSSLPPQKKAKKKMKGE